MKLYIFLLTIAAFLQSAFLGINLCLLLILTRSITVSEKNNYIIAFVAGLILGFLTNINIGFWAYIFLLVIKFSEIYKKLPFSSNFLTILPFAFIVIYLTAQIELVVFKSPLNLNKIIIESILSLPVYILVKIWEERFVVKMDTRLKI